MVRKPMFQPGDLVRISHSDVWVGTRITIDIEGDGMLGPYDNTCFAIVVQYFGEQYMNAEKVIIFIDGRLGWVFEDEIETLGGLEDEEGV
jgi:hypothetical protein